MRDGAHVRKKLVTLQYSTAHRLLSPSSHVAGHPIMMQLVIEKATNFLGYPQLGAIIPRIQRLGEICSCGLLEMILHLDLPPAKGFDTWL